MTIFYQLLLVVILPPLETHASIFVHFIYLESFPNIRHITNFFSPLTVLWQLGSTAFLILHDASKKSLAGLNITIGWCRALRSSFQAWNNVEYTSNKHLSYNFFVASSRMIRYRHFFYHLYNLVLHKTSACPLILSSLVIFSLCSTMYNTHFNILSTFIFLLNVDV